MNLCWISLVQIHENQAAASYLESALLISACRMAILIGDFSDLRIMFTFHALVELHACGVSHDGMVRKGDSNVDAKEEKGKEQNEGQRIRDEVLVVGDGDVGLEKGRRDSLASQLLPTLFVEL
jgi:hypothetical protein